MIRHDLKACLRSSPPIQSVEWRGTSHDDRSKFKRNLTLVVVRSHPGSPEGVTHKGCIHMAHKGSFRSWPAQSKAGFTHWAQIRFLCSVQGRRSIVSQRMVPIFWVRSPWIYRPSSFAPRSLTGAWIPQFSTLAVTLAKNDTWT